ncbi:uncharacterized protein LOC130894417 [Diorhabda carinulata]|uniref:uncharacterized protein LOC130894417 n=1 Tax=Diorhabda carinulata TaxID=1163345 RepID=UPI0025A0160C|nr:uncharacterized protein LOC130894417 [Diorhabda carinulata]
MTKLNIAGGSVGGLHKSMTGLSSSQHINATPVPPLANSVTVTGVNKWTGPNVRVSRGGVTVTTISPPRMQRPLSQGPLAFIGTHPTQQFLKELLLDLQRTDDYPVAQEVNGILGEAHCGQKEELIIDNYIIPDCDKHPQQNSVYEVTFEMHKALAEY